MARVAFVSGGGREIGRAISVALGARGDAVVVGDLDEAGAAETAARIESAHGRALAVALDVTDSASVASAVDRAAQELGPVEVLVNNAGWDEFHPFLETGEEFWDRVIDVNFKGCLRLPGRSFPEWSSASSDGSSTSAPTPAASARRWSPSTRAPRVR